MKSNGEKAGRPQDKWDKKAGVISKSYKVNEKTAEENQRKCEEHFRKKYGNTLDR